MTTIHPNPQPAGVEPSVSARRRVAGGSQAAWGEYPYVVLRNTAVTPVIRQVCLIPLASPLVYRPGQYVLLGDTEGRVAQRSYSIADAPSPDGRITLLVTRVRNGPTSTWVHEALRPGDQVMVEGPYGTFVVDSTGTGPLLLLGAGSGLAPVRAIAEDLLRRRTGRDTTLFFSARTTDDLIDEQDLLRWARDESSFRYLRTLTGPPGPSPTGRIPTLLPQMVDITCDSEVFAAGPPGFVVACARAAIDLGASPARVHTEEFFLEPQPWSGPPPQRRPHEVPQ